MSIVLHGNKLPWTSRKGSGCGFGRYYNWSATRFKLTLYPAVLVTCFSYLIQYFPCVQKCILAIEQRYPRTGRSSDHCEASKAFLRTLAASLSCWLRLSSLVRVPCRARPTNNDNFYKKKLICRMSSSVVQSPHAIYVHRAKNSNLFVCNAGIALEAHEISTTVARLNNKIIIKK